MSHSTTTLKPAPRFISAQDRKPSNSPAPTPNINHNNGRILNGMGGSGLGEEMELFQKGIKDESGRISEFKSSDDKCPICKTDRYSKPSLRLLISPCYHKVCESCVDKLFGLSSQTCPQPGCNRVLRKTQFHHQTFEDLVVEEEVSVRRRMSSIFNKTRKDFDLEKDYNDYLEQVEDWTYNVINNVDRPSTESKIREWQESNATSISTNAALLISQSAATRDLEMEESAERKRKTDLALQEDLESESLIEKYKKEMLDETVRGGDGKKWMKMIENVRKGKGEIEEVMKGKTQEEEMKRRKISGVKKKHLPGSPNYAGIHVPLPFTSFDGGVIQVEYNGMDWTSDIRIGGDDDGEGKKYVDREGEEVIRRAHQDVMRSRAGGYRLDEVWKRDLGLAQDSLLIGLV